MQPIQVLTRECEYSQTAAYVFLGCFDREQLQEYFESQGGFFGNMSTGAGGRYQKSHIRQGKHRTIAYVEIGLDI
jgi:hypothetical protein